MKAIRTVSNELDEAAPCIRALDALQADPLLGIAHVTRSCFVDARQPRANLVADSAETYRVSAGRMR